MKDFEEIFSGKCPTGVSGLPLIMPVITPFMFLIRIPFVGLEALNTTLPWPKLTRFNIWKLHTYSLRKLLTGFINAALTL